MKTTNDDDETVVESGNSEPGLGNELPTEMAARAIEMATEEAADDVMEERWFPDCKPVRVEPADIMRWMTFERAEWIASQVVQEFGEPHDSPLADALEVYLMAYGGTIAV